VCSLKKLSLVGCRGERVALCVNTPLGYMVGLALCSEVVWRAEAFLLLKLERAGLRASSSRDGRSVLERYTTRLMGPSSEAVSGASGVDGETVLDVELCGAVRWFAGVLEGELRRAVGGLVMAARRARAKANEDCGAREECERAMASRLEDESGDIATATDEEEAMGWHGGGEVREV
jgi:hypothetical protein